jgi:integrase/recombinase XerD
LNTQKVRLYLRLTVNGNRQFFEPVYASNGKLKPLVALVDGEPKRLDDATYYLRYSKHGKRCWQSVGVDPQRAAQKREDKEFLLTARASGLEVVEPGQERNKPRPAGLPTFETIETYLKDTSQYRRGKTYTAYKKTLEDFREFCKKPSLHQIDRRDVLNFVDLLKKKGNGKRTVANKVNYLLIFLRKHGFKEVIHQSDRPKYTEKLVKSYDPEQLKTLFAWADEEDTVLFHFFLGSGLRDAEVVYACWPDVDFRAKTLDVKEKLDLKFEVKDHEERTVPLPDTLIDLLRERRKKYPTTHLIFPGKKKGGPNHHLIRRLKNLALKAGLNCGRCVAKNGQTCDVHPVCKEWELHRFRKTFATMHADAGVKIHTLARWLGHADLETTLTYLAGSLATSVKTRDQVNSTFASLSTPKQGSLSFESPIQQLDQRFDIAV